MFEIVGEDVAALSDANLRLLVERLARAELRAGRHPLSAIIAGGNQDASDGGIDVRVECPEKLAAPDFVPRSHTGFQVKKPAMPAAAILAEMRPGGSLRPAIRDLADMSGAYIIVSAQSSVTGKVLDKRRAAMRAALHDIPNAGQLHIDFYDCDRLAAWVNEYTGVAAWMRHQIGRPLSGWGAVDGWSSGGSADPGPLLCDEKACLVDESSSHYERLTVAQGIVRLRAALREPGKCVRLVGLSGVGKTRLVRALFEPTVGEDSLDPGQAIYADYSEKPDPTAHDMACGLIACGKQSILIVDNCNPATHTALARLCSDPSGKVSLISVEYDVREDEPEGTAVFRLQSASPEIVTRWIKRDFPHVSQVDGARIAEFSDGNFRVALALVGTVGKGETLGRLKNHELFERIFQQRHEPNRDLLRAAEDLSLFYSIDGENTSPDGELARAGTVGGVGARPLYEALAELRRRGIVQARGSFRAILPQVLANQLATRALERIPAADLDRLCAALPSRMLTSAARRLGMLHDSVVAREAVARWLRVDGPLGNLIAAEGGNLQVVANLAPAAPAEVLRRLAQELAGTHGHPILASAHRHQQWTRLIKAIGYDASLFDDAVTLLARFVVAEVGEHNPLPACTDFSECFHLYLSGTQATPQQRRDVIARFLKSGDSRLHRCAWVAMESMLKTDHFTTTHRFDFGARPRDWGWQPQSGKECADWFVEAIVLVVENVPEADARALLAPNIRGLWRHPACHEPLERAAASFTQTGPWIEGWGAFRRALRFDGKRMPDNMRARLERIVERLNPPDLLNRARAVILHRKLDAWDISATGEDRDNFDGAWERTHRLAQEIGCALACDARTRAEFLAELLAEPLAPRAAECGRGLAEGTQDLVSLWRELVNTYAATVAEKRAPMVLGGFLQAANRRDELFVSHALDAVLENPNLSPLLPFLQARVGLQAPGIERLRRGIARGALAAESFCCIADGSMIGAAPSPLASLLGDIATLPHGVAIALDLLHSHLFGNHGEKDEPDARLIAVGRELLLRIVWKDERRFNDFGVSTVVQICLAGEGGERTAEELCAALRSAVEQYQISSHQISYLLTALLETQPFAALDTLLLNGAPICRLRVFGAQFDGGHTLDNVDPGVLQKWAAREPGTRYPLLGESLSIFGRKDGQENGAFSAVFLAMLDLAPDKRLFLGDLHGHLQPRSWCGSLADILVHRKTQLVKLVEHPDPSVRAWVSGNMLELDRWIERERERDRASEESFE